MNNIPESWQLLSLGELCDLYQPATLSRMEISEGGIYKVYGANGVIGTYSEYNHEESQVLLSCRGNCGTVNVSEPKSWINGNAMVCKPKVANLDKKYLSLVLQNVDWRAVITGTAQPQITRKPLSQVQIPLPPLQVQHRIVGTIEDHLSQLDKAVFEVAEANQRLLQARKSILHNTFIGRVSKDWPIVPLREVAKVQGGGTPKGLVGVASPTRTDSKQIPFFKVAEMNLDPRYLRESRTYLEKTEVEHLKIPLIQAGSLVFPKAGGAIATNKKRIVMTEGGIDTNCMAVTPKEAISDQFLYWYFESFDLMELSNGSILPQISKKTVEALPIPLPSQDIQQNVVDQVGSQLSRLDEIASTLDQVENDSHKIRRALLHAAFTGQLTTEEPND